MPTNRTKRGRHSQSLDYWRIQGLIHGDILIAGVGYGAKHMSGCNNWSLEQCSETKEEMRQDWLQYGAEFMAWWRGDTERFTAICASMGKTRDPAIIPWALTEFGEPA